MWYKESLNISDIIKRPSNESGLYGSYYSNFTPEEKNTIKNTIGVNPDDLGIKAFYQRTSLSNMASENIAFIFIAPYIQANTDINIPKASTQTSFSNLFSGGYILTQNIKGVHINDFNMDHITDVPKTLKQILRYALQNNQQYHIESILDTIGVKANDMHSKNLITDPKKIENIVQAFVKYYKDSPESVGDNLEEERQMVRRFLEHMDPIIDWAPSTTIVDFGNIQVTPEVFAKSGMEDFYNKISEIYYKKNGPSNYYIAVIYSALEDLVIFDNN